jgi:hypothetical protein
MLTVWAKPKPTIADKNKKVGKNLFILPSHFLR